MPQKAMLLYTHDIMTFFQTEWALTICLVCFSCANREHIPYASLGVASLDATNFSVGQGSAYETGLTDYTSVDFELGMSEWNTTAEPRKTSRMGLRLGTASYGSLSALEVSAPIRLYLGGAGEPTVNPYFMINTHYILWDTYITDLTPHIGLKVGGGAEYMINEKCGFTLGIDYLIPIMHSFDVNLISLEVEGLAFHFEFFGNLRKPKGFSGTPRSPSRPW